MYRSSPAPLRAQEASTYLVTLFNRAEWSQTPAESAGAALDRDFLNILSSLRSSQTETPEFSPSYDKYYSPAPTPTGSMPPWPIAPWSSLPAHGTQGHDSVTRSFSDTLYQARSIMEDGYLLAQLVEQAPNLAILVDQSQFDKASLVSKWAARFVYSARGRHQDFTSMACIWLLWHLST